MALELQEWHNQPSWDAFLGSQDSGNLHQSWAWGEPLGALGGSVTRLAVQRDGNLCGLLSVSISPVRSSSRSQLFVSRGPACDDPDEEIFGLFDQGLRALAEKHKAIGAKIEPNVPAGDPRWTSLLRGIGFSPLFPPTQPRSTWILDLQPDLNTLLANMKPKWRYNIRLATKKGVEVVRGSDASVAEFYELYRTTSQRDDFYIHDQSIYESMFAAFRKLGQFELLIARYQGTPIAAVSLVCIGKWAYYLNGASSELHREVMAPQLLQWEAIKWAKQRGASLYDFRGVPDIPSLGQEMYGVFRFKQGFGGRHVTYMESFAKGYRQPDFALYRTYWQARFLAVSARRQAQGRPHKTWA